MSFVSIFIENICKTILLLMILMHNNLKDRERNKRQNTQFEPDFRFDQF